MKKLFVMSFVSLCFGIISVVLWTGPAYAPPPGCSPVAQNLAICQGDLDVCEDDLAACLEPDPCTQIFPGDGYGNPDAFGVSGHGPALSYTDNGDGTATDDNTKFMWEVKLPANDVGGNCADGNQANRSVHCVNNTYTWSSILPTPTGTLFTVFLDTLNNKCDGDETTPCTMDSQCTRIGNGLCGHAGFRDWFIPNVRQLQGIVDYGMFSPAIDSTFPGATASSGYWSATTGAFDPNFAGGVDFTGGFVDFDSKGSFSHARAVRLCP